MDGRTMNDRTMNDKTRMQLAHEDWAFRHGYSNEHQVALAADFLNGFRLQRVPVSEALELLPFGIHLSKGVREAFYHAGQQLASIRIQHTDAELLEVLQLLFRRFGSELKAATATDGILASTGDCRGACNYNTGDRSEYRDYGW